MPFQNRIEIMATAGSFESLAAALQGGADSVYFGVGKLNIDVYKRQNERLETGLPAPDDYAGADSIMGGSIVGENGVTFVRCV